MTRAFLEIHATIRFERMSPQRIAGGVLVPALSRLTVAELSCHGLGH